MNETVEAREMLAAECESETMKAAILSGRWPPRTTISINQALRAITKALSRTRDEIRREAFEEAARELGHFIEIAKKSAYWTENDVHALQTGPLAAIGNLAIRE